VIGVLASDTTFSEKNYEIFEELNRERETGSVLMYLNLSSHVMPADFAIMNITELYHMYGKTLVATCPNTADLLAKSPVNAKKAYYMWDLSLLLNQFDFEATYRWMRKLDLYVRSEDHADIIRNVFDIPSKILPSFRISTWTSPQ
jgi:hypothetical protein